MVGLEQESGHGETGHGVSGDCETGRGVSGDGVSGDGRLTESHFLGTELWLSFAGCVAGIDEQPADGTGEIEGRVQVNHRRPISVRLLDLFKPFAQNEWQHNTRQATGHIHSTHEQGGPSAAEINRGCPRRGTAESGEHSTDGHYD